MPKKKPNPELLELKFKCSCGKILTIPKGSVSFGSTSDPCELCGSHGRTYLHYNCEKCGYVEVELEVW